MAKQTKTVRLKVIDDPDKATKVEFVTAVLALLGAATRSMSVDEIALGCHRLDPQSFSWPEYSWLPNLDNVRVTLVDVARSGAAETLTEGRHRQKLWKLTEHGREWATANKRFLDRLRGRLPDPQEVQSKPRSQLAAVAAYRAGEGKKTVPRERVIAEAYRLFPSVFGMAGYPGWPDAAAVDRAIDENRQLVRDGDAIKISTDAQRTLEPLANNLTSAQQGFGTSQRKLTKGSAAKAVARIEGSDVFRRYTKDGPSTPVDAGSICDLLSITLEAQPSILKSRISMLSGLIEQAERWDLADFVEWLKASLESRDWNLVKDGDSTHV